MDMNKVARMAGNLVEFLENLNFTPEEIAKLGWAMRRQMQLKENQATPEAPGLDTYEPSNN